MTRNDLYYDRNFVYHTTPKENLTNILINGLKGYSNPNGSIGIGNVYEENRLYFSNSLIAAYDIGIMFQAYGKGDNYVILKIPRKYIDNYKQYPDEKFMNSEKEFYNGFYILESIPSKFIENEIIDISDLFGVFKEEELDGLYY